MSSTCVLQPNSFTCESTTSSSGVMTHNFITNQHPALRGLKTTSASSNSSHTLRNQSNSGNSMMSNEIMRGSVRLVHPTTHVLQHSVILSVIRTSVDHFALVYPDSRRKIQTLKPLGSINLRGINCEEIALENGRVGLTLRPKKCDTSSAPITFVCSESSNMSNWLEAMSTNIGNTANGSNRRSSIPKRCSLPSLEEEEE